MSEKPLAKVSEFVRALDVNGVQILLDRRTNFVIRLNKTGSEIWNGLVQETSWEDVVRRVQYRTGCQASEAATAVTEFAMRLHREGWLLLDEKQISEYHFNIHSNSGSDLDKALE